MNIFRAIPPLIGIISEIGKYNKNIPAFKKLRAANDYEGERQLINKESARWTEAIARILKVTYEIEGEENIPESGPIMVYSNHQSLMDIPSILYLFRNHFQMGFVAKDEWRKVGMLAKAIEYTRSVFLVRENPREAIRVISESTDLLKKGYSLCIYPEGTRSQKHEMGEFKAGAFKFAERGNVPILPVTLDGGYKVFEENKDYRPNQTIRIKVHPIVHYELMDKHQKKEAIAEIENIVRSGLK